MRVHTGLTWIHRDGNKCCDLCLQPMQLIKIGSKDFPIWAHRGDQLEDCKALRLSYNFAKTIARRMEDFKRHLRYEMVDNHLRRFRETR